MKKLFILALAGTMLAGTMMFTASAAAAAAKEVGATAETKELTALGETIKKGNDLVQPINAFVARIKALKTNFDAKTTELNTKLEVATKKHDDLTAKIKELEKLQAQIHAAIERATTNVGKEITEAEAPKTTGAAEAPIKK